MKIRFWFPESRPDLCLLRHFQRFRFAQMNRSSHQKSKNLSKARKYKKLTIELPNLSIFINGNRKLPANTTREDTEQALQSLTAFTRLTYILLTKNVLTLDAFIALNNLTLSGLMNMIEMVVHFIFQMPTINIKIFISSN